MDDEPLAVRRLDQVNHLMHDDVLDEVLRFLDQLGVQADMSRSVVAASPLGLHPLEEIADD